MKLIETIASGVEKLIKYFEITNVLTDTLKYFAKRLKEIKLDETKIEDNTQKNDSE